MSGMMRKRAVLYIHKESCNALTIKIIFKYCNNNKKNCNIISSSSNILKHQAGYFQKKAAVCPSLSASPYSLAWIEFGYGHLCLLCSLYEGQYCSWYCAIIFPVPQVYSSVVHIFSLLYMFECCCSLIKFEYLYLFSV